MKHPGPHKYHRVKMGKTREYIVYRCALPTCTHYILRELVVGRESLCHRCGKAFILTNKSIQRAKPTCGCLSFRQERLAGLDLDALLKGK